ncbi:MAG: PAS domain S-box protein [Deltaproteobacteria bacterium]|nr:PAS domain S-box protein [Deltaproteobacteria bacterium]
MGVIIAFTLLAVAITVLFGRRAFYESRLTALDQFNKQQLILARSTANSIETYFTEVSTSLSTAVKLPSIQNMYPDGIEHLQNMYEGFLPRTSIRYLDETGILRFIYPFSDWRQKLINRDYSHDAFFIKTKQATGVSISGIIINERNEKRIRMSVPIFRTDGKENDKSRFRGALVVSFDIDDIFRVFIEPIVSGETGYAWLINHEGYFIAHYEKEFVGQDAFNIRTEKSPDLTFESINQIQRSVLAGNEGIGRYVSGWHRGQTGHIEKLIAYSPARIVDQLWSVSVAAPVTEVDRIIRAAAREAVFGFGFVLLILISAGSFLSVSAYRWSYSLEREVKKRTNELKETTDYLDNLIRSANAPIMVWDPAQRVTIINRFFEKMSGWSEDEIIGQPIDILFPDNTRASSLLKVEKASKGEGNWEAEEIPVRRKDGNIRTVFWNSYNTYVDDGKTVIATLAQGQDITDRKQAEDALRESEERLKLTLEATYDGLWDWNLLINEIYFSPRFYTMLGYKPYEMPSTLETWIDLIHPDDREYAPPKYLHLMKDTSETFEMEFRMKAKSGEWKWLLWRGKIVSRDHEGNATRMVGTNVDITERRRTREVLQQERDRAQKYLDVAEVILVAINKDQSVALINKKGCDVLGYREEEILGQNWFDRFLPERIRDEVQSVFQELIEGKLATVEYFENPVLTKTGEERTIAWHNTVLTDETQKIIGTLGSGEDITEHKRAEEERKQLEAQLRHAQKMETMGTLVAGVAHEINNPVNKIIFDIPLLQKIWHDVLPDLKEQAEKSPDRKYGGLTYEFLENNLPQLLSDMDLAANRVAKTVGNLKDFARRSNITDRRPIQINEAVTNALRLIRMPLKTSRIELNVDLGVHIPLIEGDLSSIEQSVINIILNAIQSIDKENGRVEITTGLKKKDRCVFVSISDNGQGIDPSIADKIFDPFVSNKQVEGGIGLGLSITYNIVEAHGGSITFESKKGKGTTFLLMFPSIET